MQAFDIVFIVNSWFRAPKPNPAAQRRIFVFHHAGGSANNYFKWNELVSDDVELVLCELPGRGARQKENLINDFGQLVEPLVEAFKHEITKPTFFFGHSLGALLAFEVAQRLKSSQVVGLGLSSFLPPTQANVHAREHIAHLDDETFIYKLERFAPIPNIVKNDPKARAFFLPIIRADVRLMETYRGGASAIATPAVVFAGRDDRSTSAERLQEWDKFVSVRDKVVVFPGDHFHIFANAREALLQTLAI